MPGEIVDKLIEFAKQYHPAFAEMPESILRKMFETYQNTTLINFVDGKIRGFALYQEWPDCLNFICIAGDRTKTENLFFFLNEAKEFVEKLPNKKIVFFDEEKMELKTLCHKQQSHF